jgi:hypothetical protein
MPQVIDSKHSPSQLPPSNLSSVDKQSRVRKNIKAARVNDLRSSNNKSQTPHINYQDQTQDSK